MEMSGRSMARSLSSSLPLVSESINRNQLINTSIGLTHNYSRYDELRVRIHENHLSYLNRDETPAKIEMRSKIECLIAEYLSLVPHNQKLSLIEVSNCLNRSIEEKKDFNAYKACGAFEALEKYATNLLTHPWRREYHSICPYNGFYRHVIEKHLIGSENILYLMGFVDNKTKGIFELTDSPIDPDKVSQVCLECLVAFVELQIMIQIRESLKAKGYSNISWREIHNVRIEYICGQTDAIKLICEMKRTAKLIDYESCSSSNMPKRLNSLNIDNCLPRNGYSLIDDNLSPQRHGYGDKNPIHSYFTNTYDEDDVNESFDLLNYPIISPNSYPLPPSCHLCSTHSNSLPSCSPSHLPYMSPRLVTPFPTNSSLPFVPKIQTVNKGIQAELPTINNNVENSFNRMNIQTNNNKKSSLDAEAIMIKNSQTRKDCSQPISFVCDKSTKRGNYYDNMDPFVSIESAVLSEFKSNPIEAKVLSKNSPTQERSHKSSLERKTKADGNSLSKIVNSSTSHSNAAKPASDVIDGSLDSNLMNGKALNPVNASVSTNTQSSPALNTSNGKTRTDEAKGDNQKSTITCKLLKGKKSWSCSTCTYLNLDAKDVCEMCHRSKNVGNESMPLISGGRECSRCTLVNDKAEKFCRACDTSLADSPTYI